MKIFLTGEPGVGKSTLLSAVVDQVNNKQGILTKETRLNGVRTGFSVIAATGEKITLASAESISDARVSRYGVDVKGFEDFISNLPEPEPNKLLYIDEVGQMQLFSKKFEVFVKKYLDQPNPFIGTISSVYDDDLTDEIRMREDVQIIQVTLENRDRLEDDISSIVAQYTH